MLKPLPLLLVSFFILLSLPVNLLAQCNRQDTSRQHHVDVTDPCGLAYRNGSIAVTSYNTDSFGAPATVQVWNDHYEFTDRQAPNYSFTLTAPEAAAFDASGNLYVVQTERADSNIFIYNASLVLIKVIGNSLGAAHWTNPRGIAFDSAQNLYIVSQDSTAPAPARTDIPNTGKLIKITDPLGTATKTVLLTGLNNPKAVAINGGNLYISEYGANKVSGYDLYTMTSGDFVTITQPTDLFTTGCILYCTEQGTNTIKVMNALDLSAGVGATIEGFSSGHSPSGIILDDAYNLFVSDNDSNRVVFYSAVEGVEYYSAPCFGIYAYPSLKDSVPSAGVYHSWHSYDTLVATVDTAGNIQGIAAGVATVTQIIGTDTITYTVHVGDCFYELCDSSFFRALPAYLPVDTTVTVNLWISRDTMIARVDSNGNLFGVNVGNTYVDHIINADTMIFPVFVLATRGPVVGPVYMLTDTGVNYGPDTLCINSVIQLLEDSTNGTWSISPHIANIDIDGSVWPIDTGTALVLYTTVNGCYSYSQSFRITIQAPPLPALISGNDTVCRGDATTLSDSTLGGAWSCSDTTIATISSAGLVSGIRADSATIYYSVTNYCGTSSTSKPIRVDTAVTNTIAGDTAVCKGSTITLVDLVSGGVWNCSDSSDSISNGVFTGNTPGAAIISYSVTCAAAATTFTVTVHPLPHAGAIISDSIVCTGSSVVMSDTATGGLWSSSNSLAIITTDGVVTGISTGTAIITYIVHSTYCGNDTATKSITISGIGWAGTITGDSALCVGSSTLLTNTATTGSWYATNAAATITAGGVITAGYTAGTDTIYYITSNSCGHDTASYAVNIYNYPNAGIVYGDSTEFCFSSYVSFYDSGDMGTWSITDPSIGYIDIYGNLLPYTSGTTSVIYTVSNVCGTATASYPITIDGNLDPGYISGPAEFCFSNDTFFYASGDGLGVDVWSVSDASLANVYSYTDPTIATIFAVSGGAETIIYTETNNCGSFSTTLNVAIDTAPAAGSIYGYASPLCPGTADSLWSTVAGGIWSSSNTHATIADLAGSGSEYLVVTGVFAGADTISYAVTNTCGTAAASQVISINDSVTAGPITGPSTVCVAASATVMPSVSGGVWSERNGSAAVSGGVVTGITAGTDTIIYRVTNSCGSDSSVHMITISPLPDPGTILGPDSVCTGTAITLTASVPGGVWTASNARATLVSDTVSALSAGVDTIIYSLTNACGTSSVSHSITVITLPDAGSVIGAGSVCSGGSVTLTDTIPGGLWSAANTSAAVSAGVVSGTVAGSDTILYTVVNTCGTAVARHAVTIVPLAVAGNITGADTVCAGSTITLSDTTAGGAWSSSNTHASVSGGVVTAITAGDDSILYSVTTTCGTVEALHAITVNPLPDAGVITGSGTVCVGHSATLTAGISGGMWTSANSDALVAAGTVTGLVVGTDTIIYTVTNSCGTATAAHTMIINGVPSPGAITGPSTVCQAATIVLSDTVSGGFWHSTGGSATVAGGAVLGISAGSDTIIYIVTNACGSDSATRSITILPLPFPGTIMGASTVCVGDSLLLTDTIAGGVWLISSSDATIADGLITGISSGSVTVAYTVVNSCGTDSAIHNITVDPLPVAGAISGADSICQGAATILTETLFSGTWSSANSSATVSGGVVSGVSAGTDTIRYSVTNVCGTAAVSHLISILPVPVTGVISGADSMCVGTTDTLTDTTSGGVWTLSNLSLASISAGGVITAVSAGNETARYAITNVCGTAVGDHVVNISPALPVISSRSDTVCQGESVVLLDTMGISGTWSSSNPAIATIGSTGIITCMAPGIDTVTYTIRNYCGTATGTVVLFALSDSACTALSVQGTVNTARARLSIYPNPNNGAFEVELRSDFNEDATLTITNILGERIEELKIISNKLEDIRLSPASGIYFVNVTTVHGTYVAKIIVGN
jgi:hypothetical protein